MFEIFWRKFSKIDCNRRAIHWTPCQALVCAQACACDRTPFLVMPADEMFAIELLQCKITKFEWNFEQNVCFL